MPLEGEPVPWDGVVVVQWDAAAAALLPGRVRGPATLVFAAPVVLDRTRGHLLARAEDVGLPQTVVLGPGEMLEVQS